MRRKVHWGSWVGRGVAGDVVIHNVSFLEFILVSFFAESHGVAFLSVADSCLLSSESFRFSFLEFRQELCGRHRADEWLQPPAEVDRVDVVGVLRLLEALHEPVEVLLVHNTEALEEDLAAARGEVSIHNC